MFSDFLYDLVLLRYLSLGVCLGRVGGERLILFTVSICSNMCFVVVKGLGRIGSSGTPSDQALKSRLSSVLSLVSSELRINVKSVVCFPGAKPVYKVELGSAEVVRDLLFSFSCFTRQVDRVPFPPGLENVTVYHCVTPGTRIRISLLRVKLLLFGCSYEGVYLL